MNRRINKSPIESIAAETVLMPFRQSEKPHLEIQVNRNTNFISRATPDRIQKSLKKSQSAELIKVLTEKNLEIKKLQEENIYLSGQLCELSGTMKRYKKLKGILKKKNQTIDFLRKNSQRLLAIDPEEKSSKGLQKRAKMLRAGSRLSIDSDIGSVEQLALRPLTAANKIRSLHESRKSESQLANADAHIYESRHGGKFAGKMQMTLLRTEQILKGWRKVYKNCEVK